MIHQLYISNFVWASHQSLMFENTMATTCIHIEYCSPTNNIWCLQLLVLDRLSAFKIRPGRKFTLNADTNVANISDRLVVLQYVLVLVLVLILEFIFLYSYWYSSLVTLYSHSQNLKIKHLYSYSGLCTRTRPHNFVIVLCDVFS